MKAVISKGNMKAEQVKHQQTISQLEGELARAKAQREQVEKKLEEARKITGVSAVALRKQFQAKLDELKVIGVVLWYLNNYALAVKWWSGVECGLLLEREERRRRRRRRMGLVSQY